VTARAALPELGAIERWHAEVAAGLRRRDRFDLLFRAACFEQEARDLAAVGCRGAAADALRDAANLVLEIPQ